MAEDNKAVEMKDLEGQQPQKASDEKKKNNKKTKPPQVSVATLFRYADWTERLYILLGILGGFGHGLINPLFIRTFGGLMDNIHLSNGTAPTQEEINHLFDVFDGFILTLVYLGAAALVVAYMRGTFFILVGNSMANKIRKEYLRAILRQEIGWFDSKKSGELSARLANDIPLIRDATSEKLGQIFYSIAMFISGYIISFTTNWKVGLVTMAATPVLIITMAFVGRALTMYSAQGQKVYAQAGSVAQEILSSIKTVMMFGGQNEEVERYDKELDKVEEVGTRKSYIEALSTSIPFLVVFSLYALSLWYGSTLLASVTEGLSAGDVFISFFCCTMSSSAIGWMAPSLLSLSIGRGAAFEIFEIIDRKSKIDSMALSGLKPDTCKGNISIKDVKFTYPSRPGVQVLKGVSFDVPSGKTVALVGKSGSGKSTIVALLERFYDCDEGTVTLDGENIQNYNVKWLRSRLGLVGQEPVLFAGTVAENIAIEKEDATMDEIMKAAKEANAHDFITLLPEGYNTMIMQKGANLSGGQKQRIAIARALIRNPQILLLDEATSALDSRSEHIVQEALERASIGRTTVVIAHRLSTIRNADKILVFDQGNITEAGNHDELMALNGTYANMVHLQSLAVKDEKQEAGKMDRGETMVTFNENKKAEEAMEEKKKKQKKITNWYATRKTFALHWSHEWYYNTFGIIMGIMQGGCFTAFSYVFSEVLLALMLKSGQDMRDTVDFYCIMLVVCGAGTAIVVYLQSLHFLISGERFTRRLRKNLLSNVARQKAAFFDEKGHEPAVFETILAQDTILIPKLSGRLIGQFVKMVSVLATATGLGAFFSWKLALVVLATIPLSSWGRYMRVKSIKGFATQTRKAYEKSGVVAAEAIENPRTVLSLTLEQKFLDRFYVEILQPEKAGIRDAHVNGVGYGYGECIQLLVFALAFWYGGNLVKGGEITVEGMFVSITSIITCGMVLGDTLHIFPDFQQSLDAALAYFPYAFLEPELTGKPTGAIPDKCEGNITFENTKFAYPTRPDIEVLKGFTVSVTKGNTLALVGASGCGKSTTISLIERLYAYTGGSVLLDGNEMNGLDISWVRSQIGFVGQEPVVFARSIKENIAYGIPATEEQVIEASKKANAHDFISRLPDGYNTYVGERGTQLSGGQKQRIAIARALIRNPKILLLDEATSALDSESERLVQDAISAARKGRTTVVIAHRLSTVKDADIIAVVDKGRVAEVGTHFELVEKKGLYYNFVQAQTLEQSDL